jgi:hypothetical protein
MSSVEIPHAPGMSRRELIKGGVALGAAIRWLVEDREADALRGQIVMAQRETKRRGLLPGWP